MEPPSPIDFLAPPPLHAAAFLHVFAVSCVPVSHGEGKLGDKYAVVEVGGAQQIVEEGQQYTCHRLNVPVGSTVKFPRVVAAKSDGDFTLGDPYLENVSVEAEIMEDFRAPKIIVFKYRPKKHYRKIKGHRQEMTRFRVTKILKE